MACITWKKTQTVSIFLNIKPRKALQQRGIKPSLAPKKEG